MELSLLGLAKTFYYSAFQADSGLFNTHSSYKRIWGDSNQWVFDIYFKIFIWKIWLILNFKTQNIGSPQRCRVWKSLLVKLKFLRICFLEPVYLPWPENFEYFTPNLGPKFEDGLARQLGPNHVCVILSRRRDTIRSVWYYVSHRRDTWFQASFWHWKKSLWDVLSLKLCLFIHFFNNV